MWLNEYWLQNYKVILKLLSFQQNDNELTIADNKLSIGHFQFIEINVILNQFFDIHQRVPTHSW